MRAAPRLEPSAPALPAAASRRLAVVLLVLATPRLAASVEPSSGPRPAAGRRLAVADATRAPKSDGASYDDDVWFGVRKPIDSEEGVVDADDQALERASSLDRELRWLTAYSMEYGDGCLFYPSSADATSADCGGGGSYDDQIGTVSVDGRVVSFTYYVSTSGSYSSDYGVCVAAWFVGEASTLLSECYAPGEISGGCGYGAWCALNVTVAGLCDAQDATVLRVGIMDRASASDEVRALGGGGGALRPRRGWS